MGKGYTVALWHKTMIAHHYHYLLTDVLLADGFEHFRQAVYKVGLPPHRGAPLSRMNDGVKTHRRRARAHNGSRSVPHDGEQPSWRTISQRYASTNNSNLEDFDPKEAHKYITYLDANSLYATAQSEPLLVGNF